MHLSTKLKAVAQKCSVKSCSSKFLKSTGKQLHLSLFSIKLQDAAGNIIENRLEELFKSDTSDGCFYKALAQLRP